MLDKNNNFIILSTFTFATLLISPLIIGGLQGAFSVYGATTFLFPSQSSTTYRQNVIQYDKEKTCASDQHTPTTWKTYLTHFSCGHVTILNNVEIGDNVIVGANCLIYKSIPANSIVKLNTGYTISDQKIT